MRVFFFSTFDLERERRKIKKVNSKVMMDILRNTRGKKLKEFILDCEITPLLT
jgi:hypothetical protein